MFIRKPSYLFLLLRADVNDRILKFCLLFWTWHIYVALSNLSLFVKFSHANKILARFCLQAAESLLFTWSRACCQRWRSTQITVFHSVFAGTCYLFVPVLSGKRWGMTRQAGMRDGNILRTIQRWDYIRRNGWSGLLTSTSSLCYPNRYVHETNVELFKTI